MRDAVLTQDGETEREEAQNRLLHGQRRGRSHPRSPGRSEKGQQGAGWGDFSSIPPPPSISLGPLGTLARWGHMRLRMSDDFVKVQRPGCGQEPVGPEAPALINTALRGVIPRCEGHGRTWRTLNRRGCRETRTASREERGLDG